MSRGGRVAIVAVALAAAAFGGGFALGGDEESARPNPPFAGAKTAEPPAPVQLDLGTLTRAAALPALREPVAAPDPVTTPSRPSTGGGGTRPSGGGGAPAPGGGGDEG